MLTWEPTSDEVDDALYLVELDTVRRELAMSWRNRNDRFAEERAVRKPKSRSGIYVLLGVGVYLLGCMWLFNWLGWR